MKKLSLLFALGVMTFFVACNGDDPVKTGLDLQDVAVEDIAGYYDDYGTDYYGPPLKSEVAIADTHRSYAVLLTDGTFGESCFPSDQSFYFLLNLYSPDIEEGAFVNGEYEFAVQWPQGDKTGIKFGDFWGSSDQTDTYYEAAEGTVTISGSFPNVTAKVDLDIYYYPSIILRGEGDPTDFHSLSGTFKGTLIEKSICAD